MKENRLIHQVTVRLDEPTFYWIKDVADDKKTSAAEAVRILLDGYFHTSNIEEVFLTVNQIVRDDIKNLDQKIDLLLAKLNK